MVRLLAAFCLHEKGFGKSAPLFCQAVSDSIKNVPFLSDYRSVQTRTGTAIPATLQNE